MVSSAASYDPRYLAGVVLFNRGDYFEAHEVWEALWMETFSDEKRFIQGLIQAAVGLCHFCNGNLRGAVKLYHSSRDYMQKYPSPYLGLEQRNFWEQMDRCFAPLLATEAPERGLAPEEELLPTIDLDPAPAEWPNPAEYLKEED